VVADDPALLAAELGRLLVCPEARLHFENRAYAASRKRFDPDVAFNPLAEFLGLDLATPPEAQPQHSASSTYSTAR
jgi:hypothetical protein